MNCFLQFFLMIFSLVKLCQCEETITRTVIYKFVRQKPRFVRIHTNTSTKNKRVENRILGGYECSPNEYPWMVLILKETAKNRLTKSCGGSLISRKLLLSAGHCTDNNLWAGIMMETDSEYIAQITAFYVHPKYDRTSLNNDVSVMTLLKSLKVTGLKLVKLPFKSTREDMTVMCKSKEALVMGWGVTSTAKRSPTSDTLKCVKLPVITMKDCINFYRRNQTNPIDIRKDQRQIFCTLSPVGKDTCRGDSGSPIICGNSADALQIGIVSWGRNCGDPTSPGVYARTDYFTKFIFQVIKQESKRSQDLSDNLAVKNLPTLILPFAFALIFI